MTHEEILQKLCDDTLVGNAPSMKDLVEEGLETGLDPNAMLYEALIPSLEEVGARFERGDYLVPEMLIAARAMQGALTREHADAVGADAYSADASSAVKKAKAPIMERRARVAA